MPSKIHTLPKLIAATAIGGCFLASAANATTAVTEPVGYVRHVIPHGFQPVGVSLLHEPVIVATVAASESAGGLRLDASVSIGALLETQRPYYLEVTRGPVGTDGLLVGDRLAVDVAATIASGSNRVFLKTSDPTNTLPAQGIDLTGCQVTLRPHVTIADVFGDVHNPVLQSGDANSADEVLLFDAATQKFRTFQFRSVRIAYAPADYWRAEDGSNANHHPIRPGEGVLVNRRAATATEAIVMGEVRTNAFVQPLVAGLNFVAPAVPTDQSPRDRLMDSANGFRSGTAGFADKFYVFGNGAWHEYFLAASSQGERWSNPAQPKNDFSAAPLFAGADAALVFRGEAFPDYIVPAQVD